VVSMASTVYHPANTDAGYTIHWDHFKSTKTRAEVVSELEAAIKDGSYRRMQLQSLGFFATPKGTKTREQVRQELFSMTAAEKTEAAKLYSAN
ncbi:DUF4148 domain-containing protein, partial [Variovorax sp. PCZ-1]|uniref:DUF4148 domain-containing protein n=1 Tax=Variovorax sp. PCZ-1 TaxID=2835533 RepID=UPI001BD0FB49